MSPETGLCRHFPVEGFIVRAVLLDGPGGAEVLRMGEAKRPIIRSGQVLIKVAASSVNRADINQRQGNYPPPPGESEILLSLIHI